MKSYVLDSYAIIAFFENEPGAEVVADILRQLLSNKAKGYMSIINWGEVYYSTFREQGRVEADKIIGQLSKYPIELVNADKEQTLSAAILKSSYRMAYADCFAAALAIQLKASLVTGDPEFRQLQKNWSFNGLLPECRFKEEEADKDNVYEGQPLIAYI